MPETAKILQFPSRPAPALGALDALRSATAYFDSRSQDGADERRSRLLETPEVLLSLCALLRERVESAASDVLGEASDLYRAISTTTRRLGVFDERDYFLGETAILAGTASRFFGQRAEAEIWFDRAEANFRHTVNPTPLLAMVSYQRLALRCEIGQYREVAELAPMLATSFRRLNMPREHAKCIYLEAIALKQAGSHESAIEKFEAVIGMGISDLEPGLVGSAFVSLADIHAADGKHERASAACSQGLGFLAKAKRPAAMAYLKSVLGESLRRQGDKAGSIEVYGSAIAEYQALGMSTWVAYNRVVLAQVLLENGNSREAEWQILAALPTIEEARMVPEGFAAVALLRESVRQRKTNPQALSELRQHLQARS